MLHICLLLLLPQLEQRIAANIEVARELVAQKKKERALLALKKKRLSEHQLASIQAYLMNVEDMVRWHGFERGVFSDFYPYEVSGRCGPGHVLTQPFAVSQQQLASMHAYLMKMEDMTRPESCGMG
jgi:hypothetical protein